MAAISSLQFMAWAVSARTLAAASSALHFLVAAVLPFFFGFAAGAGLPRAAAADFLALIGRGLEWVVLAALMVASRVAHDGVAAHPQAAGTTRRDAPQGVSAFSRTMAGRCQSSAGNQPAMGAPAVARMGRARSCGRPP